MKLCTLILFVSLATASAKTSYSQNAKFTLNLENVSVKELFNKIESNSEFIFVYYDNIIDLNKKVSVNAENKTVEEILEEVFKSSDNTFKVFDRQIVIAQKESSATDLEALATQQPQKKELKGKVTDEKGSPLPGVSVVVKGTTTGITTDIDGNFRLSVPTDSKTLVFSFVGMSTQEHPITSKSTFNIMLAEQTTGLSEVVAIGYGSRAKKDVTTAISTISKDAIDKSVGMSSELAMQGRMTGVQVQGGGGNPMARPTIRIRGVNTWGVSSPLYVIDGVAITEFGAGIEGQEDARAADVRGPLNIMTMIDPNDIESISVLKDASAAAIYGVRAANGVILITTKKGRGDKPTVEFSSRVGVQNINKKSDLMNTKQYADFINQVMASDPTIAMNPDNIGVFDPTSPKYLGNSATYNWQEALKNKNALSKDYSVRISGGTAKTDYFVSAGSTNNEGSFKYNYLDRLSGSFKINTQVNNWLKLGANYRITSGKGRDFNPSLVDAGLYPAWQKIYDPNGFYGYAATVVGRKADGTYSSEKLYGNGTRVNELGNTAANEQTYKSMRNMGNIYVEIEPVKHLKIKGQMSMDTYNFTRYSFSDFDGSVFNYTAGDMSATTGGNSVGSYEERDVYNNNFINEVNVNYNNTFGKHNIDVVLNGSDQQYNAKYKGASTQWMQSKLDYMRRLGGEPKYLGIGSDLTNSALQGLMGRVSYNFNSTYYLDVTVRHDGSTRFSKEKRWGTFPSASAAWRISKEEFMQSLTFINDLKLRAGYGQLGNQEVRNMAYLSPIDNRPVFAWGTDPARIGMGNYYTGAAVYSLANQDLQWEKTSTANIGLDATIMNNKLSISAEYYNKLTDGILQTVTLPISVGLVEMPVDNIASVRNTGIELSMNYNNNIGELKFSIGANLSTVKNTVEKTSGHIPIGSIEEGYSMNYIKGYKVGGIFQTQAEVDAWKTKNTDDSYQTAKIAPGDFYYLDQRSAPKKPNTFYSDSLDHKISSYDEVYLGKTIPGFYYGINLNLDYKNIDFSAQFTGVGDVQRINSVKRTLYNVGTNGGNASVDVLNAWTSANKSTTLPRLINGDPAGNYRFSDRFVESGAYCRLTNIQLGYTLPAQVYSFMRNSVSNCRIYAGASNLFTITKYSGYDPENDNYPTPVTIFMGLNVRF
ncbi:MAG: TonB-dependent receptor [Mariniphaga sp.]|nr:TonB-dependent receptor [Mariniphaga sp.]